MIIQIPTNVQSITLASAGLLTPVAGVVTVPSAVEGTTLVQKFARPRVQSTDASGNVFLQLPSVVIAIVFSGVSYSTAAGVTTTAVPAAIATQFLAELMQSKGFRLVTG